MKNRDYSFRFAEKCLYSFQEDAVRLTALRECLATLYSTSTAGVQGWDVIAHSSGVSDPVAVRELKIVSLEEEIGKLMWRVNAIQKLLDALDVPFLLEDTPIANMGKFIRFWYFCRVPRDKVMKLLSISKTSMYRLREKTVELVIKYLGLK